MTLDLKPTRTPRDRLTDLLLVLCAADLTAELKANPGRTTTQKIFFWARMEGVTHHAYIRYRFGPFSADLNDDCAVLISAGHLHKERFATTPRGAEIARHWRALLEPQNVKIFAEVDASVRKRAPLSANKVREEAYALRVRKGDVTTTLGALPEGEALLDSDAEALVITEDEIQDLHVDLSMSGTAARGMAGRATPLELLPA
jgi:uncharacterized protein YwgA